MMRAWLTDAAGPGIWLAGALAVVVLAGVARLAQRIAVRRLAPAAAASAFRGDDLLVELLRRTSALFWFALAATAVGLFMPLAARDAALLHRIALVILVIQVGLWGNGVIAFLLARRMPVAAAGEPPAATGFALIGFLARLMLWSLVILLGLQNVGVDVTALVAGLGIGGVALALAVQNILGDLFASLAIVLDKPFVLGDFIVLDDVMGGVEHIGLKTTRLRSLSGEQVVLANAELLKARIRNYRRMQERRAAFSIGITYQTPPALVRRIPDMIRSIVEAQPGTRFDRAHFSSYGDFALLFEIVYYVLSPEYGRYMDVQQAINLALLERFGREGVEFAYPTQTLLFANTPAIRGAERLA